MLRLTFNILLVLFLFQIRLNAQPNVQFKQDSVLLNHDLPSMKTDSLMDRIQFLENEVNRLKAIKNEKIDTINRKDTSILILAAVLTLVSLFMLLFVVMYLSIRRRKRLDILELEGKLKSLSKD